MTWALILYVLANPTIALTTTSLWTMLIVAEVTFGRSGGVMLLFIGLMIVFPLLHKQAEQSLRWVASILAC